MAISVTLYNINEDNRKIQKTLTGAVAVTGTIAFRDTAELHSPVFTVGQELSADLNYCAISGADDRANPRYYFAEVINARQGLAVVRCRLDVLMTYSYDILNKVKGLAARTEETNSGEPITNPFVPDKVRPRQVTAEYTSAVIHDFKYADSQGNPTGSLIMGVIGGKRFP